MTTEDAPCFPLSLSQAGMWLTLQITPEASAYNVPYLLSLTGSVSKKCLILALTDIIARHEILRTTFALQNGDVVQVVADHLPLPYCECDFRGVPSPHTAAEQFAISTARTIFDLAAGPLIKVWLLQLEDEQYQLLLVLHHMICDGWSIDVLLRELSEIYKAYHEGRVHHLPPLPIHYADFAVWQREWLQGTTRTWLVDYWQRVLAHAPALLALATDHPRSQVQSLRGAHYHLDLPYALAEALIESGQSEQCTLFMTLLAAFQASLYRITEQNDLTIGSPMANRTQPEVQGLIGLFTNMVPLRCQLSPDLTWHQLLKQTRSTILEAYAHQSLPFEELVKAVQPPRIAGASPCFQVAFSFQQRDQEPLSLPGVAVKTLDLYNGASKFDLTLHMQLTSERFTGTFTYCADLFDPSTIQRMAEHMLAVLEYLPAHPDAQLATLPAPAQKQPGGYQTPPLVENAIQSQEIASQNALEQMIIEIWQNVLGISEVGIQDNFFELGGYSLLMVQVQRQLQETLQVQISLPDLFRTPTIHALASFLSHNFDTAPTLVQQRERGRARGEALNQQRSRRQAQRARSGGTHG